MNGVSSKRRICEERIVVVQCPSAGAALAKARRSGEAACHSYRNSDGNPVHFEFVGVLDLLKLGPECGANEVWYDMRQMVNPMERRREILPTEDQLLAEADVSRSDGGPDGTGGNGY
jgi:hypothetical protein